MQRSSSRAAAPLIAILAASSLLGPGCARHGDRPSPLGIILIVVDTLRADRLSLYGHDRPTSPSLERIAAHGVVFDEAVSHSSWTLPAFVGLLSGAYPGHSVTQRRLQRSLVSDLEQSGRATAAFTEGGYVSPTFGLDLGFGQFENHEAKVRLFSPDGHAAAASSTGVAQTFGAGIAWLRAHAGSPFFLLLHTYEVHMPYLHRDFAGELPAGTLPDLYTLAVQSEVFRGVRKVGETETRYVGALYDSGVLAADQQIGRLADVLDELGIADRTLLIVTADHGEELGERSPERLGMHGARLYDSLLHIPLVMRYPERIPAGRRIPAQVRLVDVLPTVLDFAGLPPHDDLDGRSLVPILEGPEQGDRPAFAELFLPNSDTLRRLAIREDGFKLIVNAPPLDLGEPVVELYDVRSDPREIENHADDQVARKTAMQAQMRDIRESSQRREQMVPAAAPSDATREQLRALGYVE